MDLVLVERENIILGQDFLTWLWFVCDAQQRLFDLPDGRTFAVHIDDCITVQGGEGESIETATVKSPRGVLTEALTGLQTGKKVAKAKILFAIDQDEWKTNISAVDLKSSSLKTPVVTPIDPEEDPDGHVLEKMYLVEQYYQMVDSAFQAFLDERFGSDWSAEASQVKQWISKKDAL